jgi:hypothetical protein
VERRESESSAARLPFLDVRQVLDAREFGQQLGVFPQFILQRGQFLAEYFSLGGA